MFKKYVGYCTKLYFRDDVHHLVPRSIFDLMYAEHWMEEINLKLGFIDRQISAITAKAKFLGKFLRGQ